MYNLQFVSNADLKLLDAYNEKVKEYRYWKRWLKVTAYSSAVMFSLLVCIIYVLYRA